MPWGPSFIDLGSMMPCAHQGAVGALLRDRQTWSPDTAALWTLRDWSQSRASKNGRYLWVNCSISSYIVHTSSIWKVRLFGDHYKILSDTILTSTKHHSNEASVRSLLPAMTLGQCWEHLGLRHRIHSYSVQLQLQNKWIEYVRIPVAQWQWILANDLTKWNQVTCWGHFPSSSRLFDLGPINSLVAILLECNALV